jgi:hypothetical protein
VNHGTVVCAQSDGTQGVQLSPSKPFGDYENERFTSNETSRSSCAPSPPQIQPIGEVTEFENESTRKLGDWSIYKHYIKSFGWLEAAILAFISAANVFLVQFPGK